MVAAVSGFGATGSAVGLIQHTVVILRVLWAGKLVLVALNVLAGTF